MSGDWGRKGRAVEVGWSSSGSFALERRAQEDRVFGGSDKEQATAKYRDSGFARMTSVVVVTRRKYRSRFLRYATE
jgi:hypothetical protein